MGVYTQQAHTLLGYAPRQLPRVYSRWFVNGEDEDTPQPLTPVASTIALVWRMARVSSSGESSLSNSKTRNRQRSPLTTRTNLPLGGTDRAAGVASFGRPCTLTEGMLFTPPSKSIGAVWRRRGEGEDTKSRGDSTAGAAGATTTRLPASRPPLV